MLIKDDNNNDVISVEKCYYLHKYLCEPNRCRTFRNVGKEIVTKNVNAFKSRLFFVQSKIKSTLTFRI